MDIQIKLEKTDIHPNDEIKGTVTVNYPGRYDGIVINAQILDSNELITYTSYNGKTSKNVSRLFIDHKFMPNGTVEFTGVIDFTPDHTHEVKFRASIIEQHKEIESDVLFARIVAL